MYIVYTLALSNQFWLFGPHQSSNYQKNLQVDKHRARLAH